MNRYMVVAITVPLMMPCVTRAASVEQTAGEIFESSGVQGGLIVHVGCGDGELTLALGAEERYVVQGLESDPAKVADARAQIHRLGKYGRISTARWDGESLPYAENLVNLLVAENPRDVPIEAMLRVLAPRGVALVKRGEGWTKHVKPWPKEIDEWPHYLHGPDNNAVAQDRVVGPPRHMQDGCSRSARLPRRTTLPRRVESG